MSPEEIAQLRQARYNATVVSLKLLHSDLMVLRVKPDFARHDHHPGQYCTLGLGYWEHRAEGCQPESLKPEELTKIVRRSYSISCSIYEDKLGGPLRDLAKDDWLEFYGITVDNPITGSQVSEAMLAGQTDLVARHNASRVLGLREITKRLMAARILRP